MWIVNWTGMLNRIRNSSRHRRIDGIGKSLRIRIMHLLLFHNPYKILIVFIYTNPTTLNIKHHKMNQTGHVFRCLMNNFHLLQVVVHCFRVQVDACSYF